MMYILGYIVLGLLLIYGTAYIHLIRAEMKGYAAIDWWEKNGDSITQSVTPRSYVLGVLVWPERLYTCLMKTIPELYKLYDLK